MKNFYFLPFALITFVAGAQSINDDFESYTTGALGPQASHWTTWSGTQGGAEDGVVSTAQANSGNNSLAMGSAQTQDVLLLLGNQTSGTYILNWNMYVPTGKNGYWNIQESQTPAVQWNGEYYVGAVTIGATTYGSAGMVTHVGGMSVAYPPNQWFSVENTINLDSKLISVKIDGTFLFENYPYTANDGSDAFQLGAINFFPADGNGNNQYYIDDIYFVNEIGLNVDEFDIASIEVYPNPVVDVLTIKSPNEINQVKIYNVAGELVLQTTPFSSNETIDFSEFVSGIYFVEVNVGEEIKTVKIVK